MHTTPFLQFPSVPTGLPEDRRPHPRSVRPRRRRRFLVLLAALAAVAGLATAQAPRASAIVGGTETTREAHPYFVAIRTETGSDVEACGGSIIDPEWVLTAAHCVEHAAGVQAINVNVLGQLPGLSHDATAVRIHPLWNGDLGDGHDLALVRIPRWATTGTTGTYGDMNAFGPPAGVTPVIHPVQVGAPWDPDAYAPGTPAVEVGGGRTPEPLFEGRVFRLDTVLRSDGDMDDIYNPIFGWDNWDSDLMIGAGTSGHTTCRGDSGGPLTVQRNGRTVQVGVDSFGATDCDEASGYSQLDGAQLAWIGSEVPSIIDPWRSCTQSNGAPGRAYVSYGLGTGDHLDGQFAWTLRCNPLTSPPPREDQQGPDDHVCMLRPWLCPDF